MYIEINIFRSEISEYGFMQIEINEKKRELQELRDKLLILEQEKSAISEKIVQIKMDLKEVQVKCMSDALLKR